MVGRRPVSRYDSCSFFLSGGPGGDVAPVPAAAHPDPLRRVVGHGTCGRQVRAERRNTERHPRAPYGVRHGQARDHAVYRAEPRREQVERGLGRTVRKVVLAEFSDFMGPRYEMAFRDHLREAGIPTEIYYPSPLHLQPAFAYLGYGKEDFPRAQAACEQVLALPISPEMSEEQQHTVIDEIADFYRGSSARRS